MPYSPSWRLSGLLGLLVVATACGGERGEEPTSEPSGPLMNPSALNETAPASYRVRFETTKGDFVIGVHRDWSPNGADRFYNLAKNGFYDGIRFFRVIDGFMAQFGISGDPARSAVWRKASILDDPVVESNTRGRVTFAMTGQPNSRTTQVFVNFGDNTNLDSQGFAPFGEIVEGMDVVDALHAGYGEGAPRGAGPDQGRMQMQGNEYLEAEFPDLDHVISTSIEEGQ